MLLRNIASTKALGTESRALIAPLRSQASVHHCNWPSSLSYPRPNNTRSRTCINFGSSSNLIQGGSTRRVGVPITRASSGSAMSSEEVATLGGGCFWCLEACYQQLKGVHRCVSGYAGGHVPNPTYEQVCGKKTGHAEVVQVTYDPSIITYEQLLEVFFTIHDPTTPNRQGNDVGPQYRSIIMYHNEQQKQAAEAVMKLVTEEKLYRSPLVTELVPMDVFYKAEKHHQNYYRQNPGQGYCAFVVGPKVQKFRAKWSKMLMA